MLKNLVRCCLALAISSASFCGAQYNPAPVPLNLDQATGIPGFVLQPGTYTLRVVDHLADRFIMRVEGPGAPDNATFLGVPNADLKGSKGKVTWSKGPNDQPYLRGWNFGGTIGPVEFAYPKDDAVALAKANGAKVAAIDPASEGRVSNNGLSKEDMQMVTLWLLSPTHVGPGDTSGGIKAERYQQVASVEHKPVVARLPKTASYLPLIMLMGLLSTSTAVGLRMRSSMLAARR